MQKENHDIWILDTERVNYPRTTLPVETETIIIGGGITGITSVYLLSKMGKKVVLLEKNKLGEYVTSRTTGFLSEILDTYPDKLIKMFGMEKSRLILKSHREAIDNIEKITFLEKIECEFERCSNYIYANNQKEERALLKMAENYKKLGVNAEYKKDKALKFNDFGYIEIFNQAKFNVIKYLTSLAKISARNGAIIAEETEVLNLIDKNDSVLVEVKNVGIIKTKKAISATYVPFGKPKHLEHKYNMYSSYVVEYKIPPNTLAEGTYEDTLEPYHYFRVDKKNDFDRLIIGGNDNLDVLNIDHEISADIIRNYTKKLFGSNDFEEVRHWSGLISEPVNKLAYIGEYKNGNILYAFGFNGSGMTYSYIASEIFRDRLTGQDNPYYKIYGLENKLSWWKNIL